VTTHQIKKQQIKNYQQISCSLCKIPVASCNAVSYNKILWEIYR